MPFQSEKQRRYMWAKHPAIARRWSAKYGDTPVSGKNKNRPSEEEMDRQRSKQKRQRTGYLPPYRGEPLGKTSKKQKYRT